MHRIFSSSSLASTLPSTEGRLVAWAYPLVGQLCKRTSFESRVGINRRNPARNHLTAAAMWDCGLVASFTEDGKPCGGSVFNGKI